MPRPKALEKKQDYVIAVRVTLSEKKLIEQAAKREHLPTATFARQVVLNSAQEPR